MISKPINYIKQLEIRSNKSVLNLLDINKNKITSLLNSYVLKNPRNMYEVKAQKLDNLVDKLNLLIKRNLNDNNNKFINILNKLDALNPINTIKRGYSITKIDDVVITSVSDITNDSIITTDLADGKIISKVMNVEENK